MYKILVDPHNRGVIIYYLGTSTYSFASGSIDDICYKIYDYCTNVVYDEYRIASRKQTTGILLDKTGFGMAYLEILKEKYNLDVEILESHPKGFGIR